MSLPRSRPELVRLIYSWGSLWSPGGELLAVLAGAQPCPDDSAHRGSEFLGRVAAALKVTWAFFIPGNELALPENHPELYQARRVSLEALGLAKNYLVLGRWAARRWDRCRVLPDEPAAFGHRVCPGGGGLDEAAWLALPPQAEFLQFRFEAESGGLTGKILKHGPRLAVWADGEATPQMVVILLGQSRPGAGWVNAFIQVLKAHTGFRVTEFDTEALIDDGPVWSYRVGLGLADGPLAWRVVDVIPSRLQLSLWAGSDAQRWDQSAWLRLWGRHQKALSCPTDPVQRLATVWQNLSPSDLRLVWENVVISQLGPSAGGLFRAQGRLPLNIRSLLRPRVRHELDRQAESGPIGGEFELTQQLALAIEQALASKAIDWSPHALGVWQQLWQLPSVVEVQNEILRLSSLQIWLDFWASEIGVIEDTLRRLDPTDLALCLRTAPDRRWRRHVSARREAEVHQETEYCQALEARGELGPLRVLDAWLCFHREWNDQVSQRSK